MAGGGHCTAGAYGALEQPSEDQQCVKKKRAQAGRTKVCMLKSLLLEGIKTAVSCMLSECNMTCKRARKGEKGESSVFEISAFYLTKHCVQLGIKKVMTFSQYCKDQQHKKAVYCIVEPEKH